MFNVLRDYYEGTPYTLSQPKLGGGPFGSIDRYGGQESGDDVAVSGNWERSIAMYVNHARVMFRDMASYISVTTIVVIFPIDYCITKP